jgi:hypothetical protein
MASYSCNIWPHPIVSKSVVDALIPRLEPRGQRYLKSPADRSRRPFFDVAVSWNRHFSHVFGIQPDVMISAVVVQHATVIAKMAFQLSSLHTAPLR